LNNRLFNFAKLLFDNGSFSNPFIIYLLEVELKNCSSDEEKSWKFFIKALNVEHTRNYEKSFKYIETAEHFEKSKSLEFLINSRKLNMYLKMKDFKNGDRLYNYLRKNLHNVPPNIRYDSVVVTTLGYCSLNDSYENCLGKLKLKSVKDSALAFVKINLGREKMKKGNSRSGIQDFITAYKVSNKCFHVSGMLLSLNAIAWYIYQSHPLLSRIIIEKAVTIFGRFFDSQRHFYIIHTYFSVLLINNCDELIKISRLIISFSKEISKQEKEMTKNVINKSIELDQITCSESNTYKNTKKLQKFLLSKIDNISEFSRKTGIQRKTISEIINGKKKTINSATLNGLLSNINIEKDILHLPFAVARESFKSRELFSAKMNLKYLNSLPKTDRLFLIFKTYSCLYKRKHFIKKLCRKGSIDFFVKIIISGTKNIDYLENRSEWIKFLYLISNLNTFEKARFSLIDNFFADLNKKYKEKFINRYFFLEEDIRESIDNFIRNYVRYSRKWGIKIDNEDYKEIFKILGLKIQPGIISLFCFKSKTERKRVFNFLEEITLVEKSKIAYCNS